MYVQVSLLNGFSAPLLYKVPHHLTGLSLIGIIITVPLRNRVTPAIVTSQFSYLNTPTTFEIKEFTAIEPFPRDQHYQEFIDHLSRTSQVPRVHFIKRVRQFLMQKGDQSDLVGSSLSELAAPLKKIVLTDEQENVCAFIAPYITNSRFIPTLMHGVTGSGKTEVYKRLIETTIAANKTVILLLPEVTLAIQFQKLLRAQLPDSTTIIGFHSAIGIKEKRALWQRLLEEKPTLIIGVHLPILLPIARLGLIIVDEEHEAGYQEKRHPKIHSRQAAVDRAQHAGIPIILGSATPSLSSLYQVKMKRWHFFQLKRRFGGQLPTIKTVFLTQGDRRKNFWISNELEHAIADRLVKKEQTIIFLNRRGFSFFVQCKKCSFIFSCAQCSVSLTLHDNNMLNCHYCTNQQKMPMQCPSCKTDESNFIKKGIGTQQVVTLLQKMFPQARIARADMDTTAKKKEWQKTVLAFEHNEIDILVGTQTVTKGFHFPHVTLVGVLWADLNLHFPVFNATEHTLQQLIQVAGRAGRGSLSSTVIIQAMIDHHVYQYLNEIDYLQYYKTEIEKRAMLRYPPCGMLAEIELKDTDEQRVAQEAGVLAQELEHIATTNTMDVMILGPSKPPVHKIQGIHVQKIFIKGSDADAIGSLFASINKKQYTSKLFFTQLF